MTRPDADTAVRSAVGPAAAAPAPQPPVHLLGLDADALQALLAAAGQPKYRADQVLQWLYVHDAADVSEMTNLPKALRSWLAGRTVIRTMRQAARRQSADGTTKLLLACADGAAVETVWIPSQTRNTACLSSQVGCPVGCRFCASGLDGVQRNLTAGEIVEQALAVRRLVVAAAKSGDPPGQAAAAPRLSHIVLMGMGEPLANYDEVIRAVRILNAPWGLNIGARRITLSTVGLPRQIRRLADERLQINLALSLHAPDEALRRRLIPWGKVPLAELLDACAYYFARTGREITLEYVLLAGVNDQPRHARELAQIARRLRANVNLLRYNPVADLPFERPTAEAAHAFQTELRRHGVNAHVRTSRGRDVDAACGQLRRHAQLEGQHTPREQDAENPAG